MRVKHMLDAAFAITSFVQKSNRQSLQTDLMLSSALIRQLEILGEAATAVSADFKETHTSIPWRTIIGMRNRLIHAYFDINLDIVWHAATVEIPKIIPTLESIIDSED